MLGVGRRMIQHTRLLSYGVALLSVGLVIAISLLLGPVIRPTPTSLFFVAVMISAWYGGLGPGLVATVLSTLAINYYFISPYYSLSIATSGNVLRLGVFVIAALLISGLNQSRRMALQREQTLREVSETAQRDAQIAKERLEGVLSSISDGFYMLDFDWRYIYVNDRYCEMAGMSRQQLLGRTIWELFPDAVGTDFYVQLQRVVAEQTSAQFEYLYTPWQRWYEHRVYPSPDGVTVFIAEVTERKQAEVALAAQEQRYRYIFEAAGVSIWEEDFSAVKAAIDQLKAAGVKDFRQYFTDHPEFVQWAVGMVRLRDVNQVSLQLFGAQTKAELLNSLHQIFTPETQTAFVEELLAIAAAETHYATETVLQTLQGERLHVWFAITFPPASDPYDHVLVSLLDISERKQAEAALRQAEERLRLAMQGAQMGTWDVDLTTGKAIWSEPHFTMLGYEPTPRGEATEAMWSERLYPDDVERVSQEWQQSRQEHRLYRAEYRVIRADDQQIAWLAGLGSFVYNSSGEAIRSIGVLFDITERKQAEEAIRLSEQRYRTLAHAVAQLMWVNDAKGNVEFYNQRWQEYTGVTDLELGVGLWAEIIHPDDFEATREVRTKAIQTGEAYEVECRLKRADQVYRWHLARVVPLKDEQGQILYWFGTATDIDDRKQAEAERERLLAREQAAREAAEAANRIKDEFLAVVSHELRSPLNPILGWAKLLRSRQLDEQKTERALEVIERNAQMQAQLINDLLDVSRILRGKLSLDTQPVDLVATIQAAMETVRLAAEAKQIQIYTQLDPETGYVAGDAGRLQQVIWNLLTNAVKFTPEGGRVEVWLERDGDRGAESSLSSPPHARITVTDTGKGIPADFLPYVFEQFRQESSSTTRRFGGLGLGLAIVRYLVELHGGTVQADSPGEGQGATFTVKLPLMLHQPTTKSDTKPSESSLNLQGTRILVVDDDDNTREFLAFLLELHGANVIAAATADEVITTLTQFKPDVLLSDIGMPDVDGYMLMRQIRCLSPEQGGTIPAIALTAYAGEIDYRQAMAAGFQRHIAKPIEPEVLIRAIAELRTHHNG
ncbi:MAG: PAS domain S-box protein [Elainella sp. C42_A2020_010]|nr:PAS domain S-box protein [Elainella sp. C42_A2020_010]